MKIRKKISNNTTVLDDTVDKYNVVSNLSACSVEKLDKNDVACGKFFWQATSGMLPLLNL